MRKYVFQSLFFCTCNSFSSIAPLRLVYLCMRQRRCCRLKSLFFPIVLIYKQWPTVVFIPLSILNWINLMGGSLNPFSSFSCLRISHMHVVFWSNPYPILSLPFLSLFPLTTFPSQLYNFMCLFFFNRDLSVLPCKHGCRAIYWNMGPHPLRKPAPSPSNHRLPISLQLGIDIHHPLVVVWMRMTTINSN